MSFVRPSVPLSNNPISSHDRFAQSLPHRGRAGFEPQNSVPEAEQEAKTKDRGMITRSKALLDNLEEESSDSEDEEGNFMTVSEEMVEPTSFHEAYHDQDPNRRNSWRNAIAKELENMEKCNVWSLVDMLSIPTNRKLIGSNWVFKEMRDGVFRARLVALGYSQVPGIDFTGNYLPVVNDTSFRT
jgi:Reverse transcriptase (RNA-dependent DNA polymerase)